MLKKSLGARLAAISTGTMVLVLLAAVGIVSTQLWRQGAEDGEARLMAGATAATKLLADYEVAIERNMKRDIGTFKREFGNNEPFAIDGSVGDLPRLAYGGKVVTSDFQLVDSFTVATGAVATVFARNGDDLVRVTTSVKDAQGKRAIGTKLDRKHPAYEGLLNGKGYVGEAKLFGKLYGVVYEPVVQDGKTIAVLFVGTDLQSRRESLATSLAAMSQFERGMLVAAYLAEGASKGTIIGNGGVKQLEADALKSFAEQAKAMPVGDVVRAKSFLPESPAEDVMAAAAHDESDRWVVISQAPGDVVMKAAKKQIAVLVSVLAIAVIVLAFTVTMTVRKMVVSRVASLERSASVMAQGDLTAPLEIKGEDEIARLSKAFEGMRERIVHMLMNARLIADRVASSSQEIATGSTDLSQRTEQQASSLQQTASAMDELSSTVGHNADNAKQADQLARDAATVAKQGGERVSQVVQTMRSIEASSKRIVEIISVIDGVAFQTNILALNAAVEAARAGEQGRGFAVVASEVRALAARSADAAKEIKSLISSNVDEVERGTQLVAQTSTTMDEIVASIRKVSETAAEISSASAEQNSGIQQIVQAVGQMDAVTQQNTALVEESASSAETLSEQAKDLLKAVAAFKLSDSAMQSAAESFGQAKPQHAPRIPPAGASSREVSGEWANF